MIDDPPRLFEDSAAPADVRHLLQVGRPAPTESIPEQVLVRGRRRVAIMATFPALLAGLFKTKTAAAAAIVLATIVVAATTGVVVFESGSGASQAQEGSAAHAAPLRAPSFASTGTGSAVASFTAAAVPVDELPQAVAPSPSSVSHALAPVPAGTAIVDVPPGNPEDRLAEEVRLLQEAKALVRTNPSGALAKTREHGQRFPKGTLALEREMVTLEALVSAGRMQDARRKADALRPNVRGTIYASRLEALVGSKPNE